MQDEFALQTLPNSSTEVGFVTGNVADGTVHAEMVDGAARRNEAATLLSWTA